MARSENIGAGSSDILNEGFFEDMKSPHDADMFRSMELGYIALCERISGFGVVDTTMLRDLYDRTLVDWRLRRFPDRLAQDAKQGIRYTPVAFPAARVNADGAWKLIEGFASRTPLESDDFIELTSDIRISLIPNREVMLHGRDVNEQARILQAMQHAETQKRHRPLYPQQVSPHVPGPVEVAASWYALAAQGVKLQHPDIAYRTRTLHIDQITSQGMIPETRIENGAGFIATQQLTGSVPTRIALG